MELAEFVHIENESTCMLPCEVIAEGLEFPYGCQCFICLFALT